MTARRTPTRSLRRVALASLAALALGGPALLAPTGAATAAATAPAPAIAPGAVQAAEDAFTLDARVRSASSAGLAVDATARGVVLPAEGGGATVTFALGPAGLTDPASVDPSAFAAVVEEPAAAAEEYAGALTTTLTAEADRVLADADHAVYAWQSDGEAGPGGSASTPLEVDRDALGGDVVVESSGPSAHTFGRTDTFVWLAVRGVQRPAALGGLLTGLDGARVVAENRGGGVLRFRVPERTLPGTRTLQLEVTSPEAAADGLVVTRRLVVSRAATTAVSSFEVAPGPRRTGSLLAGAVATDPRTGSTVPRARGPIAVKVYRADGSVAWSSGVQQLVANAAFDGLRRFAVPALPAGSYRLVVGYGGSNVFEPSSATRTFSVR
ncbi:hypothetical protein INN71_07930 [Nocardioides sp. ChNu-153]|uniref:hypothetical protein n=1 Tax=unclassified Nocardioides TaxID=2615069 RepID=UPI002405EB31|nr:MULTISPECIES: hypothetical protein [unclassified Nocardioides]MDF9718012.1 hypothetical protein [Nocardioides sp. ChNu-99]MDN7121320.1 hypothetical protein [Nocardioides sp. ChNu-153]